MNVKLLSLAGVAILSLPSVPALASLAQPESGTALWEPGEILVADGESKTVLHSKTDQHYRICVKNSDRNVALRVLEEGNAAVLVPPGGCSEFEGKSLRVEAADRLPEGEALVVPHQNVRWSWRARR